jgi:hypothetical protein
MWITWHHIIFIWSDYHQSTWLIKSFDYTLTSLENDEIVFSFWIISSFLIALSFIFFTHAVVVRSMIFVSINFVRVWHELIFVIASIEFVSSSIHRIFVISFRSYNWRRHIKSIINRFSDVVSSLTRQSYSDLESVSSIIDRVKRFKIRWMIDLMIESASSLFVIAYSFAVTTLLIILLHFVKNQWMMFVLTSSVKQKLHNQSANVNSHLQKMRR